jgi:hypothetical protein
MKQIMALSVVLTIGMFCSGFAEENGFDSIEGFFSLLGLVVYEPCDTCCALKKLRPPLYHE